HWRQVWNGIKSVAAPVTSWLGNHVVPFFSKTIPHAFSVVTGWVRRNWPWLLGALTGPIGLAVVWIVKHWDSIYTGIKNGWNTVVRFVKTIPGKFRNALLSLPGLLFNLGRQALNQLWRGALSLG